ncbi:MAG: glycosyltransferase family 2 protein [Halobacteriaceae archaeon]
MGTPRFSIVTPSYNHAQYLEQTIESVKAQGTEDVEHIVVDGDSTDGTTDLLRRHEDDYELRWVSEPDRGQTHALNKGIRMAEGEYLGWQNADDYYLPGAFDVVRSTLQRRPDVDMVYGDLHIVDADGSRSDTRHFTRPSRLVQRYLGNFMANQSAFIKTEFFDDVGPFNEGFEYAMDVELFWKLLNYGGEYVHVPEYLAAIRIHDDMKSVANRERQSQEGQQLTCAMDRQPYLERLLPERVLTQVARGVMVISLAKDGRINEITDHFR